MEKECFFFFLVHSVGGLSLGFSFPSLPYIGSKSKEKVPFGHWNLLENLRACPPRPLSLPPFFETPLGL